MISNLTTRGFLADLSVLALVEYGNLRRMGMDHDSALRAAYSLRWDDERRLADDDPFDDDW